MKKFFVLFMMIIVSSIFAFGEEPPAQQDFDVWYPGIVLREGVTATIHCKVYVNESRPDTNAAVFAIHGAAHTAATWSNFAEALFAHGVDSQPVSKLIAIDLPGHGQSSLPEGGLLFGDITLEDCVNVVLATIDKTKEANYKPNILIAHSMGTMIAQKAQALLVDRGTSFKKQYNIDSVILLAPTLPAGMPYFVMDSGMGLGLLSGFATWDPYLGAYLSFPNEQWPYIFFTNRAGLPVAGMPLPAEVIQRGYNAPESATFGAQIVGIPPVPRPTIDRGVFGKSNKTDIVVVGFENDILLLPEEGQALYSHLTDDDPTGYSSFVFVPGPDTAHDFYISGAAALVDAIF